LYLIQVTNTTVPNVLLPHMHNFQLSTSSFFKSYNKVITAGLGLQLCWFLGLVLLSLCYVRSMFLFCSTNPIDPKLKTVGWVGYDVHVYTKSEYQTSAIRVNDLFNNIPSFWRGPTYFGIVNGGAGRSTQEILETLGIPACKTTRQ
jgi:hypothetical protein